VTLLQMTPEEVRAEVVEPHENFPEVLSGWRSLEALYDPRGLLSRLKREASRPTASRFQASARLAILAAYEDYGKLLDALDEGDLEGAREMAIWFTGGAAMALLCLERRVPPTGRRIFVDLHRLGSLGMSINRLRYGPLSLEQTERVARRIWRLLLRRARARRIRLPGLPWG